MRAPNAQGCALNPESKELSVAVVGDIIRNCDRFLAEAASERHGFEIRVSEADCGALLKLYPDFQSTHLRLIALINEALAARQMRYRLGDVMENYGCTFLFTVHVHAEAA